MLFTDPTSWPAPQDTVFWLYKAFHVFSLFFVNLNVNCFILFDICLPNNGNKCRYFVMKSLVYIVSRLLSSLSFSDSTWLCVPQAYALWMPSCFHHPAQHYPTLYFLALTNCESNIDISMISVCTNPTWQSVISSGYMNIEKWTSSIYHDHKYELHPLRDLVWNLPSLFVQSQCNELLK